MLYSVEVFVSGRIFPLLIPQPGPELACCEWAAFQEIVE